MISKKYFACLAIFFFVASVVCTPIVSGVTTFTSGTDDKLGWKLVVNEKSSKLHPELKESVWEMDRPPYGQCDKIALRRLVKKGGQPKGVVFIFPGTWSNGEAIISEDHYDLYLKSINADAEKVNEIKNMLGRHSICKYLALKGFDVYSMDYRTHFVPKTYGPKDIKFMKDWGWKMYMGDMKLAVDKAKEVSGEDKIFLGGESFGGLAAMNYASQYGSDGLKGIILLDGGTGGKNHRLVPVPLPVGLLETGAYGMMGMYALDQKMTANMGPLVDGLMSSAAKTVFNIPHFSEVLKHGLEHPLDLPKDPVTGKLLEPTIDPNTGKPFANYIEWINNRLDRMGLDGLMGVLYNYIDAVPLALTLQTYDRYWPLQVYLEYASDISRPGYESDGGIWNRDYYNYYAHYKEIDVPMITFISKLGLTAWGPSGPGIKNTDVTNSTFPDWGHLDIYMGIYNEEKVNEPVYQWLMEHL
ncbi:MAG: Alpha/beta hydrolase family protein [Candidatus Methanolliviera sp. GoM_oil]|nr:MAG: Alpha/beta hydrolase family protein [Candidatus Methanolliviera sp. GoM_oil]